MGTKNKINSRWYKLSGYQKLFQSDALQLDTQCRKKITQGRSYLEGRMTKGGAEMFYGINTGFGSLHSTKISNQNIEQLQTNLVLSHACGTGEPIHPALVRHMLLLKVLSLRHGHSGVRGILVEALLKLFNSKQYPQVFAQGSLGASGDLAPLAHCSLVLLGKGKVWKNGRYINTNAKDLPFKALKLKAKEGLALLNGTQFMQAHGLHMLLQLRKLWPILQKVATVSLETFQVRQNPFHPSVQEIRHHPGQMKVAKEIRTLRRGVKQGVRNQGGIQDPYSFRCIPQVHGASLEVIQNCETIFEREMNAVTDNPLIFPQENEILSGGNFHGQILALHLDFLAIALSELASISERRTYKLIGGQRGLPQFLIKEAGLNSGFMIPQYTAASIVSQNKQLCTPASVDTIDSSNGQEDHVSMGANAATKCLNVFENLKKVLAIELMCASQAAGFRKEIKWNSTLKAFLTQFQQRVPFIHRDRDMSVQIAAAIAFIEDEIHSS